ncbi:MAG: hypothetical protein B7Z66_08765 [Chromatiales bacterium 21-64-14]|nr:MAG: hypothetical protein B7Z66_08765 [Chromatiales bacterium 21-64-14]HQU16129.1 hypothetical protein [Gammaproteobacteria bacterium]
MSDAKGSPPELIDLGINWPEINVREWRNEAGDSDNHVRERFRLVDSEHPLIQELMRLYRGRLPTVQPGVSGNGG